jgi:hypothetical protein
MYSSHILAHWLKLKLPVTVTYIRNCYMHTCIHSFIHTYIHCYIRNTLHSSYIRDHMQVDLNSLNIKRTTFLFVHARGHCAANNTFSTPVYSFVSRNYRQREGGYLRLQWTYNLWIYLCNEILFLLLLSYQNTKVVATVFILRTTLYCASSPWNVRCCYVH